MKYCSKCGKPLPEEGDFCPGCGTRISPGPAEPNGPVPPGKRWLPLGVAVAALTVATVIGWLLLTRSKPSEAVTEPMAGEQMTDTGPAAQPPAEPGGEPAQPDTGEIARMIAGSLEAELVRRGLPKPDAVAIEEEALVIRFAAGSGGTPSFGKPADLLPVLLLGRAVASGRPGPVLGRIVAEAAAPDGATHRAEASAELLDRYLAKEITPKAFSDGVRLETRTWKPTGQTAAEKIAACRERGERLMSEGRHDLAVPLFQEAHQLDRDDPATNKALALCLYRTRQLAASARHLEAAQRQSSEDPELKSLAASVSLALHDSGNYLGSLELAERFLGSGGLAPTVEIDLSLVRCAALFNLGRYPEAEQWSGKLTERYPKTSRAWYWYARALTAQNRFKEALGPAKRSAEMDPDNYNIHFVLGMAQNQTKNYRDAIKSYEKSWSMMRDQKLTPIEGFFVQLSYCYAQLGDATNCARVAGDGLKHYPESENLRTNYKVGYKAGIKKR